MEYKTTEETKGIKHPMRIMHVLVDFHAFNHNLKRKRYYRIESIFSSQLQRDVEDLMGLSKCVMIEHIWKWLKDEQGGNAAANMYIEIQDLDIVAIASRYTTKGEHIDWFRPETNVVYSGDTDAAAPYVYQRLMHDRGFECTIAPEILTTRYKQKAIKSTDAFCAGEWAIGTHPDMGKYEVVHEVDKDGWCAAGIRGEVDWEDADIDYGMKQHIHPNFEKEAWADRITRNDSHHDSIQPNDIVLHHKGTRGGVLILRPKTANVPD